MERALGAIQHRGPNARGIHLDPKGQFALGHVRLSVIDVSAASNQPFWSACGRYVLIYNGEIYNYLEIRKELEREGVAFRTTSDTEVLLQAMIRWGVEAINKFNGMWAFVFGDVYSGAFVTSRDRWGVKPLFTMHQDGMMILCSEAKGIFAWLGTTPQPNHCAVGRYLKYGAGGESAESWFDGVERFPPTMHQTIQLNSLNASTHSMGSYWNYPVHRTIHNFDDAIGRIEELLTDAVSIRLRSDVPIGLSLSAGVDSGAIAWIVGEKLNRKLEAYTAWHQPVNKSQLPVAQEIARRYGHQSTSVDETDQDNTTRDLRTCIHSLEAAHSSPAIIPYLNLCRAARSSLTVMLEGQGADELLGGYQEFSLFASLDHLMRGNLHGFAQCLAAYAHNYGWQSAALDCVRFSNRAVYTHQAHRWNAKGLLGSEVLEAVPEHFRTLRWSRSNFSDALHHWHRFNLTNLLQYGDAISMSVNLETRCPFLDYRLVEFGFSLGTELLMNRSYGKYLLRKCAEAHLPKPTCWSRKKDGFSNSTTRMITKFVEQWGLPSDGVELAMDLGILKSPLRSKDTFLRLPPNIQFRTYSLLQWLEVFYGRDKR